MSIRIQNQFRHTGSGARIDRLLQASRIESLTNRFRSNDCDRRQISILDRKDRGSFARGNENRLRCGIRHEPSPLDKWIMSMFADERIEIDAERRFSMRRFKLW
jgi:hypothetical protein